MPAKDYSQRTKPKKNLRKVRIVRGKQKVISQGVEDLLEAVNAGKFGKGNDFSVADLELDFNSRIATWW